MTVARAHLVDPSVTRWYQCVTRCVRRAFLLGEGTHDRKGWIEQRLEELAEIFSVAVAGFAILDNHLHLLVRLDPDVARGCSDARGLLAWRLPVPSIAGPVFGFGIGQVRRVCDAARSSSPSDGFTGTARTRIGASSRRVALAECPRATVVFALPTKFGHLPTIQDRLP